MRLTLQKDRIVPDWDSTHSATTEILSEVEPVINRKLARPFTVLARELDSALLAEGTLIAPVLPLAPKKYLNARIVIDGEVPESAPSGQHVIANKLHRGGRQQLQFGYEVSGQFRYLGPVDYIQLNAAGEVEEISFPSTAARDYFFEHLNGIKLSRDDKKTILKIQKDYYEYLSNDPQLTAQLEAFMEKREWSDTVKERARKEFKLAKYDPEIVQDTLHQWIREKKYGPNTRKLLYHAGIVDLSMSREGKLSTAIPADPNIRIPYFNNRGQITTARRRMTAPKPGSPKYLSSPMRREALGKIPAGDQLFNHHKLKNIKGKNLILTEGEFKAMVAEIEEGTTTISIPGITQMTPDLLNAIVRAQPGSVTVILDRDPTGKAWQRVDGVTDSSRAAYRIAKALEDRGLANVKVGSLPDVFEGEKVGIDDLILSPEPGHGVERYKQVIAEAIPVQEYAKQLRLDTKLDAMREMRGRMECFNRNYALHLAHGGRPLTVAQKERLEQARNELQEAYETRLAQKYQATRPNESYYRHNKLKADNTIVEHGNHLTLCRRDGTVLPNHLFGGDMMVIDVIPENTPDRLLWGTKGYERSPITTRHVHDFLSGQNVEDEKFNDLLARGMQALRMGDEEQLEKNLQKLRHNARLLSATLAAGYLSTNFPEDEFRMDALVETYVNHPTHLQKSGDIPLLITKDNGRAVAVASFPVLGKTVQAKPLASALIEAADTFNHLRDTTRPKNLRNTITHKRHQIVNTLFSREAYHTTQKETENYLAGFGVSADTSRHYTPRRLTPEDVQQYIINVLHEGGEKELMLDGVTTKPQKYSHRRRLLHQAEQMGLVQLDASGNYVPRFKGDILLLPMQNKGEPSAILACPLDKADYRDFPAARTQLFVPLNGKAQDHLRAYQAQDQFFQQDQLAHAEGKPLIIASNPLEAMLIQQANRVAGNSTAVVALTGRMPLSEKQLAALRQANPSEIHFVMTGPQQDVTLQGISYPATPAVLRQLQELQPYLATGKGEIPLHVTLSETPATQLVSASLSSDALMAASVPLKDYLRVAQDKAWDQLSGQFHERLEALLDHMQLHSGESKLNNVPILPLGEMKREKSIVGKIERSYELLSKHATEKGITEPALPPLDEYLQHRLGLKGPISLEDIAHQNIAAGKNFYHKPISGKREAYGYTPEIQPLATAFLTPQTDLPLALENPLKIRMPEPSVAPARKPREGKTSPPPRIREFSLTQNPFGIFEHLHQKLPQEIRDAQPILPPTVEDLERGAFCASGTVQYQDKTYEISTQGIGRNGARKAFWQEALTQMQHDFPMLFQTMKIEDIQAKQAGIAAEKFADAQAGITRVEGVPVGAWDALKETLGHYGYMHEARNGNFQYLQVKKEMVKGDNYKEEGKSVKRYRVKMQLVLPPNTALNQGAAPIMLTASQDKPHPRAEEFAAQRLLTAITQKMQEISARDQRVMFAQTQNL